MRKLTIEIGFLPEVAETVKAHYGGAVVAPDPQDMFGELAGSASVGDIIFFPGIEDIPLYVFGRSWVFDRDGSAILTIGIGVGLLSGEIEKRTKLTLVKK